VRCVLQAFLICTIVLYWFLVLRGMWMFIVETSSSYLEEVLLDTFCILLAHYLDFSLTLIRFTAVFGKGAVFSVPLKKLIEFLCP
jgi:hypothetical protein